VDLHLKTPSDRLLPMAADGHGYYQLDVSDLPTGATYLYRLADGAGHFEEWPDPASRSQPHGVHGPSQTVDLRSFAWTDQNWPGFDLASAVIYELHVGTYTPAGTFDGVIEHLDELAELGVTVIEIMPVAQFPGSRNWGYDGVYLYAPQHSYGGAAGLQRLVDAAHQRGLAVVLDVVYNHLGPEGNYLGKFGRYFTKRYSTPWGEALNFDGRDCGPVRDFFIGNALYWLEHYHIDGLRLDAIDGIRDFGARHVLAELQEAVQELAALTGKPKILIGESDLNDTKVLASRERFGFALDAQWSDDFHHSLHTLLTGETTGYYADFGSLEHLAETMRQGWFYDGKYSGFRGRRHGNSPRGFSPEHFVVCIQNHDQTGNRVRGDRLSVLVDQESLKLAAGVVLLSPFVPMLFMGEEYGENAPFVYFTSHEDAGLIEAVRKGRREEAVRFGWKHELDDPQSESTFDAVRLRHELKDAAAHRELRAFYRGLLAMRRDFRLGRASRQEVQAHAAQNVLVVRRETPKASLCMVFHFGKGPMSFDLDLPPGNWRILLDSSLPDAEPLELYPRGATRRADEPVNLRLSPRSFLVLENPSERADS
jgi:maltooligosyltrehalose trehalohydrolase